MHVLGQTDFQGYCSLKSGVRKGLSQLLRLCLVLNSKPRLSMFSKQIIQCERRGVILSVIRIRDVAKYAKVSPSTVSRTLTGSAYVDPEKKARVLKAVKELNYKPNMAARVLKKGHSKLIGLVIPDITNPFYPEVVQHLENYALMHDYSMILCDSRGDSEKEAIYFQSLRDLFVDGIFYLAATENVDHIKPYVGEIPLVIINRDFDINAPCINIDNQDAAHQAMGHLLENGHRNILVMISGTERQYNQNRLEGVELALRDYDMTLDDIKIVRGIGTESDALEKVYEVMRGPDRPTGIFLFNDFMAFGVYKGIRKAGFHIPDDVSIVGFDDIPHMKFLDPSLTTIRHAVKDVSSIIFDTLLEQMESNTIAEHSYVEYPCELVIRDSVRDIRS